jgi:hypothetical protein
MNVHAAVPSFERALREENDFLRERVRQLEELLKPRQTEEMTQVYVGALGISPAEARLLWLMYRREFVNRDQYQAACCTEESDGQSLLSVRVCFLRRKLRPFEISVGTTWGQGYYMPAQSKKNLQKAIEDWIARGRPIVCNRKQNREARAPVNVHEADRRRQVLL